MKLIEEVFTPAQKKEMIARLTDAMVAIEGENMRPVTWVTVEDWEQSYDGGSNVGDVVIRALRKKARRQGVGDRDRTAVGYRLRRA